MNRREFTKNLSMLISQMITDGHEPILDYLLRSKEEQKRLFDAGLSKCDGVIHPSDHQKALAFDLYFVLANSDGSVFIDFGYEQTADLAIQYHNIWVSMGGKPLIEWDKGHYGAG